MLQITVVLIISILLMLPMGKYLYHIATRAHTFGDPVFDRVDNLIYKVIGVKNKGLTGMNWKKYIMTLLLTNAVMVVIGYFMLRIQAMPFLNPNQHLIRSSRLSQTLTYKTILVSHHYLI